jgi:hypothetical protein
MPQTDVQTFLDALPGEIKQLVSVLRNVIRGTAPHAKESVLWGGLSYHRPEVGGRVKGAICQIVLKEGQVGLDFIHGIRLADPCGMLQGDRLSKRFIPIETIDDTRRPEVEGLIREAAALNPAEWRDYR